MASASDKEKIIELANLGLSQRVVADRLDIPRTTVRRYWPAGTVADPVEAEQRRARQDAQRKEHVDAVKELAFRRFLADLVEKNVRPFARVPVPPKPLAKTRATERAPLICLTDWHFEEQVAPAGVLDLNEYSIAIACRRLHRIVQAAIAWKRDMESAGRYHFPGLTVACLGDFLTGTLHGLERHSTAPNIVRAVLACGDLLALALADLAAVFPKVRVVGVSGNHGRLPDDRKVPTKDPTRSWDYLAYEIARRRLAGARNVEWHLPESYGVLFEVGGHLCYASHGNFIPNNLGIVGYGVRRFTASLASNLNAAGKKLRYCYFGHWHQKSEAEFAGLSCFICPSLIGAQEYSFLSGGSVNRPAQLLHVFDRDLGLVSQETLYGEGPGFDGAYEVEP